MKDEVFVLLDNYVKYTSELCESLKRDIKNGGVLSTDTIIILSNLQKAADAAAKVLEVFDGTGVN